MTVLINASNTSGLTFSSDTSGSIAFQSNGSNVATIQPAGFSYPGGVIQVVVGTLSTSFLTTSSTFVDTGLTATITPKFATSKVLVMVNASGCYKDTNNTWLWAKVQKNNADWQTLTLFSVYTGTTSAIAVGSCCGEWLDTPATTSALTYKLQAASAQNNANIYINNGGNSSSLILMEIAV